MNLDDMKAKHQAFNRVRHEMLRANKKFTQTTLKNIMKVNGVSINSTHITRMIGLGLLERYGWKRSSYLWKKLISEEDFSEINPSYNTFCTIFGKVKKQKPVNKPTIPLELAISICKEHGLLVLEKIVTSDGKEKTINL